MTPPELTTSVIKINRKHPECLGKKFHIHPRSVLFTFLVASGFQNPQAIWLGGGEHREDSQRLGGTYSHLRAPALLTLYLSFLRGSCLLQDEKHPSCFHVQPFLSSLYKSEKVGKDPSRKTRPPLPQPVQPPNENSPWQLPGVPGGDQPGMNK